MKKVLILAYDFPPYVSVGGLRPYAWYKYLHEFDVEPIVITRQWSNEHGNHLDYISASKSNKTIIETSEIGTIIKTAYSPNLANRLMLRYGESRYSFFRKSISAYYELTQWFWNIGPKSKLYYAAREYLRQNKVDTIIATGDPFILFKYASKLSHLFNIPWIADYRDPWTQDKSNSRNIIFKKLNEFFEKKYLKNVSLVTTVSEFFTAQISTLVKKEFIIIPNGYNPEAVKKINDVKPVDLCLRIGFAGTIYKWHPIESFLNVVSNFLSENENALFEVNFYGINIPDELQELLETHFSKIKKNINIYPKISNDLLLMELAKNNILLLFNDYSIIGTKIYDYIGIKRPVLLCYANDKDALILKEKYYSENEVEGFSQHLQEDLIIETESGYIIQDTNHLRLFLNQLYLEFVQKGFVKCNTKNSELYSRKEQTKKLAEIITNI
ncbi:MAG: hypothetical protein WCP69_01660 [Bacteroidota bacterium]